MTASIANWSKAKTLCHAGASRRAVMALANNAFGLPLPVVIRLARQGSCSLMGKPDGKTLRNESLDDVLAVLTDEPIANGRVVKHIGRNSRAEKPP